MRQAASPGSRVMVLLVPQIFLGAAIAVYPDTEDPLIAQILLLLHVTSAIASLLAVGVWLLRHARGRVLRRPAVEREAPAGRHVVRLVVLAALLLAYGTGLGALWSGEGSLAGDLHAAAGLCAGLPLAVHLLLDGRGLGRGIAWLFVLVSPLAIPSVRMRVRPKPLPSPPVTYAPHTRAESLYDSAEWCGRCHSEQLAEWSHTTHARAVSNPNLRAHFTRDIAENGPNGVDSDLEKVGDKGGTHCIQCHGPTTYYGANPTPVLKDTTLETQGISCGFCHTLRGRGADRIYLSAPETVSRYLGQNSPTVLMRELGDLLIRWRPEVHRRDYHVPYLDRAAMCAGCHFESYQSWKTSPYAGHLPDPAKQKTPFVSTPAAPDPQAPDAVLCQDCHMAREPNGEKRREEGRLVPWGPVRPQRRYHGWAGGNTRVSHEFGDDEGIAMDRLLRKDMLTLRVVEVHRDAGNLVATVGLRNNHVGHTYPTGEGGDVRSQYLQLELLDGNGHVLGATSVPEIRAKDFDQRELPGRSVALIHQRDGEDHPADRDTRIPPRSELQFHLSLADRPGLARVRVSLHSAFDLATILSTEFTP